MGTWGVGIFLNDTAADLLEGLARSSPSERLDRIGDVVRMGADAPNEDESEVLPEEVIVAAAVLAAHLNYVLVGPAAEEWPAGIEAWLEGAVPDDLVQSAVRAIDIHTGPGTWWRDSWDREEDRAALIAGVERIRAVLTDNPRKPARNVSSS